MDLQKLAREVAGKILRRDNDVTSDVFSQEHFNLIENDILHALETAVGEGGPKRDGDWMDTDGACKVCGGEIPHGHSNNCDIYKMEQELTDLRAQLKSMLDLHWADNQKLINKCSDLEVELEQARKDGERLSWLEQRGFGISCGQSPARTDFCYQLHDYQFTRKGEWHESVRAAIDTARQAAPPLNTIQRD